MSCYSHLVSASMLECCKQGRFTFVIFLLKTLNSKLTTCLTYIPQNCQGWARDLAQRLKCLPDSCKVMRSISGTKTTTNQKTKKPPPPQKQQNQNHKPVKVITNKQV